MALFCVGVCGGLAVTFYGIRPNGVTVTCSSFKATSRARHCSSSKSRLGNGQQVVSRLQRVNAKYEHFLQRRKNSARFRLFFQDAKEVKVIKTRMLTNRVKVQDLTYRDMEKLGQFCRDMIKAIPLLLISIPPFANYLVFVLMYLFLRQLLIRHFWTRQQQTEFQEVNHSHSVQHHWAVGLRVQVHIYTHTLCKLGYISDIQAIRDLFSGPPLGIKRMNADQMRQLCPLFFLTPRFPTPRIATRLNSHGIELLQLDRALSRHGLHQLDDSELRQVSGLDSGSLSINQCLEWLSVAPVLLSSKRDLFPLSRQSLLLHSMVLLSTNYPKPYQH
uniref:Letm1 RBD domain-containing protein n=1 Tax=Oncorhynchus mykiss TaxID=8022 RepID=A0A8C7QYB9_ONCMY